MSKVLQHLVSNKKKRLQHDGFDLDLTYITEQVIAMGLPSTGLSGIYRNPQSEVIAFLSAYHADQYKIYNLCTRPQDQYDPEKFGGSVASYPFDDHGVPPLRLVDSLARSVKEWLEASQDHVVCIHCLAGKGRTGLMVCASLLLMGILPTAAEAMAYYGEKRMKNKKGVTQASQRRWVEYYQQTLARPLNLDLPRTLTGVGVSGYPDKPLALLITAPGGAVLHDTGPFTGEREPSLQVTFQAHVLKSHWLPFLIASAAGEVALSHTFREDVCLQLNDEEGKPLAQLWMHAAFIDAARLVCDKKWFDLERHNSKKKRFKKVAVTFTFADDGTFGDACGKTLPPSTDGWYAGQEAALAEEDIDEYDDDDDAGRSGISALGSSAERSSCENEPDRKEPVHLLSALGSALSSPFTRMLTPRGGKGMK